MSTRWVMVQEVAFPGKVPLCPRPLQLRSAPVSWCVWQVRSCGSRHRGVQNGPLLGSWPRQRLHARSLCLVPRRSSLLPGAAGPCGGGSTCAGSYRASPVRVGSGQGGRRPVPRVHPALAAGRWPEHLQGGLQPALVHCSLLGQRTAQIAEAPSVSSRTVERYSAELRAKLHADSPAELVLKALQPGLLVPLSPNNGALTLTARKKSGAAAICRFSATKSCSDGTACTNTHTPRGPARNVDERLHNPRGILPR